jgi:hypothetical protein
MENGEEKDNIIFVGSKGESNWRVILIGFILAILVKTFFGSMELLGLLIVGFLVGFLAKGGPLSGMLNAAIAGALGVIILGIFLIIFGAFFGLVGLIFLSIPGFIAIILYLIYYGIIMGIAGAIGGIVAENRT